MDETGQDTLGKLFLVAVVIKESKEMHSLEKQLEEIEKMSGKRKFKWKKIKDGIKKKYLSELLKIRLLKKSIFYSIYKESKEYTVLTAVTIAKSVLSITVANYTVTVIIDGLNEKEREVVSRELKKLKIKYKKIRGMRDETNVFLRLADAMAGFLREVNEGKKYTTPFIKHFKETGIISQT